MKPALLWMEHVLGFERFWDGRSSTPATCDADADDGLGAPVDRDVGSELAA